MITTLYRIPNSFINKKRMISQYHNGQKNQQKTFPLKLAASQFEEVSNFQCCLARRIDLKGGEIIKTQIILPFNLGQSILIQPMHFSRSLLTFPIKVSNKAIQLLAYTNKVYKIGQYIYVQKHENGYQESLYAYRT